MPRTMILLLMSSYVSSDCNRTHKTHTFIFIAKKLSSHLPWNEMESVTAPISNLGRNYSTHIHFNTLTNFLNIVCI